MMHIKKALFLSLIFFTTGLGLKAAKSGEKKPRGALRKDLTKKHKNFIKGLVSRAKQDDRFATYTTTKAPFTILNTLLLSDPSSKKMRKTKKRAFKFLSRVMWFLSDNKLLVADEVIYFDRLIELLQDQDAAELHRQEEIAFLKKMEELALYDVQQANREGYNSSDSSSSNNDY